MGGSSRVPGYLEVQTATHPFNAGRSFSDAPPKNQSVYCVKTIRSCQEMHSSSRKTKKKNNSNKKTKKEKQTEKKKKKRKQKKKLGKGEVPLLEPS